MGCITLVSPSKHPQRAYHKCLGLSVLYVQCGDRFTVLLPIYLRTQVALHTPKRSQCKPEVMPFTVRHKCILILYVKPG